MTAKRAYRFRPDGPQQTKPPVMVKVNGALCEARNIAVAMALDGAHPTTIWNKFRGAVTGHQISQWLYEARKLGHVSRPDRTRLSAVVDVASLLGRETAAVRWTVYELRDLETELDARGVRVPRRWFTPDT